MGAFSSQPENVEGTSSLEKAFYSGPSVETTPGNATGKSNLSSTENVLNVTLLGDEWSSSAGGLSTVNRELAIHLSDIPTVKVSLLVPEETCKYEEKQEAHSYGIAVVEAKKRTAYDRLDWLSFPPQDHIMDVVVGHGVKLGRQVQFIRDSARFPNCKWIQVVHTAPEDLSRYKCYTDPISKGETKHQSEVDLCKLADLVVPIGPRLKEAYSSYLQRCKTNEDVLPFTPGLFQREFGELKQSPNEHAEFKVLLFGRGDNEDFELKGYTIAAEAFTYQRLKNKPYHLIFVGAPEGKQEEVRKKLLQCGILEQQLTVRKFVQSRDGIKDLFCEVDLVIMPSKSEGFGLAALEALSAGLPILVGSRSGFAKALGNILHGHTCIVSSDDPAKWAEEIEAVRVRHGMRIEEIKALRASYGETYSWNKQCKTLVKRIWKMVHGASDQEDSIPKTDSAIEKQPLAKARSSAGGISGQQRSIDEVIKPSGTFEEARQLSGVFPLLSRTPSTSGSTSDQGCIVSALVRLLITLNSQDLSDDQRETIDKDLKYRIHVYAKHHDLSSPGSVEALAEFLEKAYNLAVMSVETGSLIITVRCPTLESLERLWNDCQSGYPNHIAERFLVTDELKRKLGLDTVRLTITIEQENYLICKKAFMDKPGNEAASQHITSQDASKEKTQVLTHIARAQKAKASRGSLHKAAISGQCETIKMLLENGEDVDQRDQFSLTPLHLACWYGQESVVKLLFKHGANVNAEDRFQRTPLQKAGRQNHHSIVQLLVRNDASPCLHQPDVYALS